MTSKTILITGASQGLGAALVNAYARPNTHLILIARNIVLLKQMALLAAAAGATVQIGAIDVRDAPKLAQFIVNQDKHTPIDLVIANAGVGGTLEPDWQPESPNITEAIFATNLQGTLNTISPLIEQMIARKQGQIAIVSSLAGLRGLPQSPSYCAAKAALITYGQSLRAWLSRYHIQVNVILPGFVKTAMSDELPEPKPFLLSADKAAYIIKKQLTKNKAQICFPWQLYMLSKLMYCMPSKLVDKVLNQFKVA